MRFSHTASTMLRFSADSERLFNTLPQEFSKKEFESIRKGIDGHPISLQVARDLGIVKVVREEPATYTKEEEIWTDPKGRKYSRDEMYGMGVTGIAALFDCCRYESVYQALRHIASVWEEIEYPTYRNIFRVDMEKFKAYCE